MMRCFLSLFLLVSCTNIISRPNLDGDEFDLILQAMKEKNPSIIHAKWGPPDTIESFDQEMNEETYKSEPNHSPIYIRVNKKSGKILWIRLLFWKDFDNYAFLKEKFGNYKWTETPLESPMGDVVSEPVHVTIPEIAVSFEYDNHLPQRRVMEVFFE